MLNTLLNLGIKATSAKTLADNFGGQPEAEFLEGLDEIAFALAFKRQRSLFTPTAAPWDSIYKTTYLNGHAGAIDQGYTDALQQFAPDVQVAIGDAVDARRNEFLQFGQQVAAVDPKSRTSKHYRKIWSNIGFSFRYNLVHDKVEVNGVLINDAIDNHMRVKLRDARVKRDIPAAMDVMSDLAHEREYHPIKDYLAGLMWDGQDHIGNLAKHFVDANNAFELWLRRWLIGAVARVYDPNAQNRMLVLDGAQEIGKDHFAEWLCPLPNYFRISSIVPDDKDFRIRRKYIWIWDVDEFGFTSRKSDREALKAFITDPKVDDRKPYGRHETTGNCMTSFIATVNNESGLLSDPTGSRRFMIAHIKSIDWNYRSAVDVNQIWAQAYSLYQGGETWKLIGAERDLANEINEQYQSVDIVEDTICKWFEIDPAESWWMSTVDIIEVLKDTSRGNLRGGSEVTPQKLSSALTHLNLGKPRLHKVRGTPTRGYFGIKLKSTIP
jgi:predicted P-loop ATPase